MTSNENPTRRLTLRELLSQAEKCSRDLSDVLRTSWTNRLIECRELSRPVRRRSSFPSILSLINSLEHLQDAEEEIDALILFLIDHLKEIREHAVRERFER